MNAPANTELEARGNALVLQLSAVIDRLGQGQAYSSTLAAMNHFAAALRQAASVGAESGEAWSASKHDEIIKRLMAGVGMPNSASLYTAFKQLANELHALASPSRSEGGQRFEVQTTAPVMWICLVDVQGEKRIRAWTADPKRVESLRAEGLEMQPLFTGAAQASPGRGDLTKIAAECHRAKWQFDFNDENRLPVGQARDMVKRAFGELHRIGDMALKLRDGSALPSADRGTEA